jgi:hypothetical protein
VGIEAISRAGCERRPAHGEAPGSIVRVHSAADPNPVYKGYATKVQEARQSGAEPVPD